MKLNLGACDRKINGYLSVDMCAPADIITDLSDFWPWEDSSVDEILAFDIIEHLPDKIFTMNEAWRVLKNGALLKIEVPTTGGPGAFQDPTHVSFWNERSFLYYEKGNPYRERFAVNYGIHAAFRIKEKKTKLTCDGPKLTIILEAIK